MMDTTEQYIKMCEMAEEIQGHEPQAGDYYFAQGRIVILPMKEHIEDFCTYECLYLVSWDDEVWLPRQDQLQKMVDWTAIYIIKEDGKYYRRSLGTNYESGNSMEQLWLAFVMKEKYDKVWGGEDWHTQEGTL